MQPVILTLRSWAQSVSVICWSPECSAWRHTSSRALWTFFAYFGMPCRKAGSAELWKFAVGQPSLPARSAMYCVSSQNLLSVSCTFTFWCAACFSRSLVIELEFQVHWWEESLLEPGMRSLCQWNTRCRFFLIVSCECWCSLYCDEVVIYPYRWISWLVVCLCLM